MLIIVADEWWPELSIIKRRGGGENFVIIWLSFLVDAYHFQKDLTKHIIKNTSYLSEI